MAADGIVEYTLRVTDQASPSLDRAAESADEAAAAARRVQAATAAVDAPMRAASASMGAAAAATGNLRAQLIDIGVMLQAGASPLTILSTQGPQVAEAMLQMRSAGVSVTSVLGGLGPILLALAPAVLALGGAWAYLSAQLDAANRQAAEQAERATQAAEAAAAWAARRREVTLAYEVAAGVISATDAQIRREEAATQAAAQAMRDYHRAQVQAIEAEIQREGLTAERQERLHAAREAEAAYAREVERVGLMAEYTARAEAARVQSVREAAAASRAAAEAARRAAAADDAARRAAEARARAIDAALSEAAAELTPVVDAAAIALRAFYVAIDAAAPTEAASAVERLALAEADLALALSRGALSAEQYAAAMADLATARERAAAAEAAAVGAGVEAGGGGGTTATDVLGAAAGGPSALLSLLGAVGGPIGAGIAAGLSILAQAGQTTADGRDAFAASFADFFDALAAGVPTLGASIAELAAHVVSATLPALAAGADELVAGLLAGLPAVLTAIAGALPTVAGSLLQGMLVGLPQAIAKAILMVLSPSFWADLARAFADGVVTAAGSLARAIGDALRDLLAPFRGGQGRDGESGIGRAIRDAAVWTRDVASDVQDWFVGMFGGGTTYVPRTGLALVHQGERIVQRGSQPGGSGQTGAARSVVVHVHVPQGAYIGTVPDIVRELNRSLGAAGLGLTWQD